MPAIETLKEMLQNNTPRERIIKGTEDKKGILLVEKISLVQFEMSNQDAMNMVIELLEVQILAQQEIPGEKGGSEESDDLSNNETPEEPENESLIG